MLIKKNLSNFVNITNLIYFNMKKQIIFILLITSLTLLYSQTIPRKREFRAVWIATVTNIDWPSSKYLSTASQQSEIITILNRLKAYGMNAILIQIRPSCDAFYAEGRTEPWSEYLMGTQGAAPTPFYDPLKFIITEAKKRGIEVHGWFNPYRSVVSSSSSVHSSHISKTKPEWNLRYNTPFRLLDPGIPDVREYVTNVVVNVFKKYDIQGIHFDDYFYPYEGTTTHDSVSQSLYKPPTMNVKDWRRENVNQLIRMIYDSVKTIKPSVKFGISPFGIYRPGIPPGITGFDAYDGIYCDPVKWLNEQIIDYIMPQLYWAINKTGQEYYKLMPWWTTVLNGRHLYTGNGAHNMSTSGLNWPASELADQIRLNRMNSKAVGACFFSSKWITNNTKGLGDTLRLDLYKFPAFPPTMPWKDSIPPLPVENVVASLDASNRVVLEWQKPAVASDGDSAKYFVIYKGIGTPPNIEDPRNIRYITTNDTIKFTDTSVFQQGVTYYYYVTAMDKLHNESAPSNLVTFVISDVKEEIIEKFTYNLAQNFPNPFNPSTSIRYEIENAGEVELILYDILGNEIAVLEKSYKTPGKYIYELNMNQYNLPSGVYLYKLQSGNFISIKKMMYIK